MCASDTCNELIRKSMTHHPVINEAQLWIAVKRGDKREKYVDKLSLRMLLIHASEFISTRAGKNNNNNDRPAPVP